MMPSVQTILVVIAVALAGLYLVHRLVWPLPFLAGKKKDKRSCGQDNCGCS